MKYEIQRREIGKYPLATYNHTLDYNYCKRKYNEYALMSLEEFKKCLKNPQKIGEIGHLSSFIYWFKNKERHEYRESYGDYGLSHLLFHCLVDPEREIPMHAEYIHLLFQEDIKLV
ncbi:hypothetical protein U6A24_12680 [Aquimarina gracilis]|uniref:Uncharacterized protein n=1 Tax=Aquimarina gracilis TaxID=874422 RepID=A0ABU5ZWS4_9FLAO|nr:hypothetical protein [Aquimarina gracilis]MEB3346325.1 hypothetical protein [Aquimarina gracilis]